METGTKGKRITLSKKTVGIICGCALVGVCGGGYAISQVTSADAMQGAQNAKANAGVNMMGTSAYMQETVATGDIVVGISETGTASMEQTEISYDFGVEVATFYVKAGEDVTQGQALALLDMTVVNEAKDALSLEIADAETALAEAQAEYDVKAIQAAKTLAETNYNGENAEYLYSLALAEVDARYQSLKDTMDEHSQTLYYAYVAQEEGPSTNNLASAEKNAVENALSTWNLLQDSMPDDTESAVSGAYAYYYQSNNGGYKFISETVYQNGDGDAVDANGVDQSVYDNDGIKYTSYQSTSAQLSNLKSAYDVACSAYDTAYATEYATAQLVLDNAVVKALENYQDAEDSYNEYGKEMELSRLDAYADYETILANYAAAQDVYANTMAKNANAVETAEQALETLQTQYEAYADLPTDGVVLSPCGGYIMSLAETETAYKEDYALITIGSNECVELRVSISQDDIASVAIGMETNVIFDAYEEYTIPAVVESISTSSASGMTSSVNYTLAISCDISAYPELVVFDSMSATVTFVQRQESNVIMVSSKCITTENGVSYVKVLGEDGELTSVPVETGFSDGFDVEIVSGLSVGDIVVIESAVG